MASAAIPDPSPPFNPFKDCSQEICSVYCPQWCYILFPPPPPPPLFDDTADSTTYFSPLIVAVIGILASAFILVTYYAVVSKYCRRRGHGDNGSTQTSESDRANETHRSGSPGLDEALIKSISVFKFKKGEALIDGTDCSVCLSEFEEDESLRLLPKCSHAFHLSCIDAWLKTNSSCPLCRCNIGLTDPPETRAPTVSALGYRRTANSGVVMIQDLPGSVSQRAVVVEIVEQDAVEPSASVASSPALSGGGDDGGESPAIGKWRNRSGVLKLVMKKSVSAGISAMTRSGKWKDSNLPV